MNDQLKAKLDEISVLVGAAQAALTVNDIDHVHLSFTYIRDKAWEGKQIIHEDRWEKHRALKGMSRQKAHDFISTLDLSDIEDML